MLRRFAGVTFAVVLLCLVVEIGAHVVGPRMFAERPKPGMDRFPFLTYDPYVGWRNREFKDPKITRDGLRVCPGETGPRVLWVGDSRAFGIWKHDETYHYDGAALDLAAMGYQCTDRGVLGYTSFQVVRTLMNDHGTYDAVVIWCGWNDHSRGSLMQQKNADSVSAYWLNKSATGRILLDAMQKPADPATAMIPVDVFDANMRRAVRLAKAKAPLVIVCGIPMSPKGIPDWLAYVSGTTDKDSIRKADEDYRAIAKRVAADEGVIFLDRALPAEMWDDTDPVHPNKEGMRAVAEVLNETISSKRVASR